jgi:hypothetical protein
MTETDSHLASRREVALECRRNDIPSTLGRCRLPLRRNEQQQQQQQSDDRSHHANGDYQVRFYAAEQSSIRARHPLPTAAPSHLHNVPVHTTTTADLHERGCCRTSSTAPDRPAPPILLSMLEAQ